MCKRIRTQKSAVLRKHLTGPYFILFIRGSKYNIKTRRFHRKFRAYYAVKTRCVITETRKVVRVFGKNKLSERIYTLRDGHAWQPTIKLFYDEGRRET